MEYLLLIISYLSGSIPFGLIIGKSLGVDVRKSGSGNIGATNVNRQLGKKYGILTLAGDMVKAVLPMLLAAMALHNHPLGERWILFCGAAAFLGHLFPLYLGFKGGKGVATALGIFAYLTPSAALIALILFALVVIIFGYVSLGSLVSSAIMPFLVWAFSDSPEKALLALFIALFIWAKHWENIIRLLQHKEKSWKSSCGATGYSMENKNH